MNYVTNEQIQEWLNQGLSVRSAATGRVGRVLGISENGDVIIKSIKPSIGKGVTTFERGDQVSAMLSNGGVVIINADLEMQGVTP